MKYFLVKSRYYKEDEFGALKTINEQHLFDSVSYTEAETKFHKQFQTKENMNSERTVVKIDPYRIDSILDDLGLDKWYKIKCYYMSVDEISGKEKKVIMHMLVNANYTSEAQGYADQEFKKWLISVEIDTIQETKILDVFQHESTI